MLYCEICEICKNTLFHRAPFYSACFCVCWKSGENFSPEQLTNPMLTGSNINKNFTADVPIINSEINDAAILSLEYVYIFWKISWRTEITLTKIKLSRNCKNANLSNLQNRSQRQAQISEGKDKAMALDTEANLAESDKGSFCKQRMERILLWWIYQLLTKVTSL